MTNVRFERMTKFIHNHVVGRYKVQREIVKYAIQELIKEKYPTRLLVYGEPFNFDVDVGIKGSDIHRPLPARYRRRILQVRNSAART